MNICRPFLVGFILICVLFVSSCDLINPEESVPSYISIDKVEFYDSTRNVVAIPNAHRITDAWVYIDGKLQGVYELPATFPVLASGPHTIIIRPGILENGIAATREIYQFYTSYTITPDLIPGKIDTLHPVISYDETSTVFVFPGNGVEDFESGSLIDSTPASKVKLDRTDVDSLVFEDNYSAVARMNTVNNVFVAETSNGYLLPGNGTDVFLEMNYRTDVEIEIGLIADRDQQVFVLPKIVLNPAQAWKKIYINFADEISSVKNARYKIYFKAQHDNNLSESELYLDNVKLLY